MQLEGPGAEPVPTPDVPAQPDPAAAPGQQLQPDEPQLETPEGEEGEEGEEQQPRRGSMLADLIQERTRRQMAEQTAQQHNELVRSILAQEGGAELLRRVSTGQPPGPPAEDTTELEAVAADLGLLRPDGSPDLDTARRIQNRVARQVQQAVQPLQHQSMQMQAEGAIQHTLAVARSFGADPAIVERGLRGIPPDQAMNPQVQQATILLAMGLQGLSGQGAQPPQAPMGQAPLITEGVRGRGQSGAKLDPVWRGRLQGAGLKDTEIDGALRGYDSRRPQKLE